MRSTSKTPATMEAHRVSGHARTTQAIRVNARFILSGPLSGIECGAISGSDGRVRAWALAFPYASHLHANSATLRFRLIHCVYELSEQLEAMTQVQAAGSDGCQFLRRSVTSEALPRRDNCMPGALPVTRGLAPEHTPQPVSCPMPNGSRSPRFVLPSVAAALAARALRHRTAGWSADIAAGTHRPSALAVAAPGDE
jgi:hypothetical protein